MSIEQSTESRWKGMGGRSVSGCQIYDREGYPIQIYLNTVFVSPDMLLGGVFIASNPKIYLETLAGI